MTITLETNNACPLEQWVEQAQDRGSTLSTGEQPNPRVNRGAALQMLFALGVSQPDPAAHRLFLGLHRALGGKI